jgi:hypothetical protein
MNKRKFNDIYENDDDNIYKKPKYDITDLSDILKNKKRKLDHEDDNKPYKKPKYDIKSLPDILKNNKRKFEQEDDDDKPSKKQKKNTKEGELENIEYIKWGQISNNIVDSLQEKKRKLKDLSVVARKFQYSHLDTMKEIQSSGRLKLKRFDSALEYLKTKHGVQIGHKQQSLLDAIRISFFPIMFGEELISNVSFLKKYYDLQDVYDMFAGLYPRREGKTVIVAIIAAIFMVTQPHGNIISYNIGKRQSDEFMDLLKGYLELFKDSKEFGWVEIALTGKEKYTIYSKLPGTMNTVYAYGCGMTQGKISMRFFIILS